MNRRIALALGAALLCSSTATAQKLRTVGIGVAMRPATIFNDPDLSPPLTSVTVPLTVGSFRIEPEMGFAKIHSEEEDPFGGETEETNATILAIGTGAYFLFNRDDAFLMYAGPRFGMVRGSGSYQVGSSPEQSVKRTAIYIGAALGGEHFFSSHFSIGGEARLTRISFGAPEFEPDEGVDIDMEESALSTDGLIFVRLYF